MNDFITPLSQLVLKTPPAPLFLVQDTVPLPGTEEESEGEDHPAGWEFLDWFFAVTNVGCATVAAVQLAQGRGETAIGLTLSVGVGIERLVKRVVDDGFIDPIEVVDGLVSGGGLAVCAVQVAQSFQVRPPSLPPLPTGGEVSQMEPPPEAISGAESD